MSALIEHTTVAQMVTAFGDASREIRQGFALLESAQNRLRAAFQPDYGGKFAVLSPQRYVTLVGREGADDSLSRLRRDAWQSIIQKLQIRPALSDKRWRELEEQLERGELPEITAETIEEMVAGLAGNLGGYFAEAVTEVFEFLRPRHSSYKTNTEFEIGRKVIIPHAVEKLGGVWRPDYYRTQRLIALENVTYMLDGKHRPEGSYYGPLCSAIQESEGQGETEHFKFKCFKNGNLHLEFKRPDLVAELNKIAGGNRLKGAA